VRPVVMKSRLTDSAAESAECMTRKEAANYLRVSPAHISNLADGKVPGVPRLRCCRIGRRLIFKKVWLDEFVETRANELNRHDSI